MKLAGFGMNYRNLDHEISAQNVTTYNKYFPLNDQNTWQTINGQKFYIDGYGRPSVTYIELPPMTPAARQYSCQSKVSVWVGGDFYGGHLIASQIGGWGGPANLVPMQFQLNNEAWKIVENAVRKCKNLLIKSLKYEVRAIYSPFSSKVTPYFITASIFRKGDWLGVLGGFSNDSISSIVNDLEAEIWKDDLFNYECKSAL